jgi:hypothetical protein
MGDTETIKRFVRETLGCACEDAVFRSIDQRVEQLPGGATAVRLEIGHRLLVRAVSAMDATALVAQLPQWVAHGIEERDALGLNRFRLVLCTSDPSGLGTAAREMFDGLPLPDERVHLHVLPSEALSALTRSNT